MPLPVLKGGIYASLAHYLSKQGMSVDILDELIEEIDEENPMLLAFILSLANTFEEPVTLAQVSAVSALMVYKALKSQQEADDLTDLIG